MSVTRAWAALVALSLGSALAAFAGTGLVIAVMLCILCVAKARLILDVFLGLSTVPGWQRGFSVGLGVFMVALTSLGILG